MEELLHLLASLRQVWRSWPPSPEQFPSPLDAAHGSSAVELTHPFLPRAHLILFWVFMLQHQWKTLSHPGKPNSPYLVHKGRCCFHSIAESEQDSAAPAPTFFFFLFSAGAEYWHFSHSIFPSCFLSSKNNKKGR